MRRVEGAAHDPDGARAPRGARFNAHRPSRSQASAPHSNSVRPIRTVSPGATPARRSASSMPEPGKRPLEPLRRLLDIEVRLGRDPLDAAAADHEQIAVSPKGVAAVGRFEPVDHDAARLRLGREASCVGQKIRQSLAQDVEPVARPRGDRHAWNALRPPRRREGGPRLASTGEIGLVERDDDGLLEERLVVEAQLVGDHPVAPLRVAPGAVDHVDEHAGPLHVAQEGMSEAGSGRRTLDEAGHVGDRRAPVLRVIEVHDAEVRLEGRELVVGDLRPCRGQRREKGRLAGVREPDEADVGDEAQLETEPALLPGLALLGVLRRLVRRAGEVDVAEPAAPAAPERRLLPDRDEVSQQLAGGVVEDAGPGWHADDHVAAGLAVAPRAGPAPARLRPELVLVAEVAQGGQPGVHPQDDAAAAATVSAVGSSPRDVRLTPEGRCPVAAVAGTDPDLDAVEEHRGDCRTRTADRHSRPPRRRRTGRQGERDYRYASGLTRVPPAQIGPRQTSKWRCGPVAQPLAPRRPMYEPRPTPAPAETATAARWLYVV